MRINFNECFSYDDAVAIVFIWIERRKKEKNGDSFMCTVVCSYSPAKIVQRWGTLRMGYYCVFSIS